MEDGPTTTPTAVLVKSVQEGDARAPGLLIARYWDRIAVIVRARLGTRLRRDLETVDILQETFAHLQRDLASFEMRSEAALVHYLAKVAQNRILDAVKRQNARGRQAMSEAVSLENATVDVADSVLGPGSKLAHDEQSLRLAECLSEMPEPQRELILCRKYEGFPWDEVAQRTGRASADAARVAHAKALADLGRRIRSRRQESETT